MLDILKKLVASACYDKHTPCLCLSAYLTKPLYSEGSRSFKVIDVDIFKKLVASACYDTQHVCVYLQPFSRYTSKYSGRITFFKEGCPCFVPSFVGTQWHEIFHEILETPRYGENPKFLSYLPSWIGIPGRDRQSDRITIANKKYY